MGGCSANERRNEAGLCENEPTRHEGCVFLFYSFSPWLYPLHPSPPPRGVQDRRCRGMSPRRQDVAGAGRGLSRSVAGGSRRRRGLSRRRRGGSPCREVSRGVARGGREGGSPPVTPDDAVAVCRAAGVAGGSPPVAPPSRSVAGCRGCRGPSFSVKTATCTWTPIGGGGSTWSNHGTHDHDSGHSG